MTGESDKSGQSPAAADAAVPAAPVVGSLVKPPHGHGMIRYGSRPGQNSNNRGRPKDEIRGMLRDWLWERFDETPELVQRWGTLDPEAKIRAMDMALEYGV